MVVLSFLATLSIGTGGGPDPKRPVPTKIEVAEGIYLFQSAPYSDVGLDGNSVVIVSTDGVLVFDSNGTPAGARAVLASIRAITNQPIKYLMNSHWHWDHWYGAEVYREAYPGVEIISHVETRRLMAGPAMAFNQPGLDHQLPDHIKEVEAQLAKEKTAELTEHLAQDRFFLEQKRTFHPTLATITFTDSLTIHLGQRVIQVLHHDRAITPGDVYLFLPNERIVVAGDLLINPITFALFCYPDGWIGTLEAIDRLDAAVLVPGHGQPMRDETILHTTHDLLVRERSLALAAKARGVGLDQAIAEIKADPEVGKFEAVLVGSQPQRKPAFGLYLVDWFVKRVYQAAEGPLDNSIPAVP